MSIEQLKQTTETDLYANMAYFSDVIKGQQPYRLFKYTEDYAGSLVYLNTDVRYYPMGEDVWPDFVDDLKEAKKYIFLEYFIINPGKCGIRRKDLRQLTVSA